MIMFSDGSMFIVSKSRERLFGHRQQQKISRISRYEGDCKEWTKSACRV